MEVSIEYAREFFGSSTRNFSSGQVCAAELTQRAAAKGSSLGQEVDHPIDSDRFGCGAGRGVGGVYLARMARGKAWCAAVGAVELMFVVGCLVAPMGGVGGAALGQEVG